MLRHWSRRSTTTGWIASSRGSSSCFSGLSAPTAATNAPGGTSSRVRRGRRAGVQAGNTGDFWTAVSSLQKVGDIQPGYKDTAIRLAQLREEALEYGLGGLVYPTNGGAHPGLYLIDHLGQPLYLPGSDGKSQVRATSPDGEQL